MNNLKNKPNPASPSAPTGNILGIKSAPLSADATRPDPTANKDQEKELVRLALDEQEHRDWFQKQRDEINKRFDKKEQEVERKQLIQTLTQALTQFGAAKAGLKSGVDMSNLKFVKKDFEKELDRAARKRESEMNIAGKEVGARRRLAEALRKEKARVEDRDLKISEKAKDRELQKMKLRAKDLNKPVFFKSADDIVSVSPEGKVKVIYEGRRTNLSEKRLEHYKKEKDEPTPAQIEQFVGLKEANDLLNKMKESKIEKGIDTGPIANVRNKIAQFIGIDDPVVSTLRQDFVDTLSKKVKTLSGTAASDKERGFLSFSLPNLSDNDEQFLAKIDNAIKNIELAKKARIEVMTKGGRDVSKFKDNKDQDAIDWVNANINSKDPEIKAKAEKIQKVLKERGSL